MFKWKREREKREKRLATENERVEKVVEGAMGLVEDERDNLRKLDNVMGTSSPRFYSKKTVRELDEDRQYTMACLKYVMFDLEATRKENEYLRKLLEEAM